MAEDSTYTDLLLHVTGEAVFTGDRHAGSKMLYGKVVTSTEANARIKLMDITRALNLPGVCCILSAGDIPGENQLGTVITDEYCLAPAAVTFRGQAIALIAAESRETAEEAAGLIRISYEPLEPVTDLETAMMKNMLIAPQRRIVRGDPQTALEKAPHVLNGRLATGSQEHWYLETQSTLAVPGEGSGMKVFTSSQAPLETQMVVARVLGLRKNQVEVEVNRIGGGFGGKETQANHIAAWAALLAHATRLPVRLQLRRTDDQRITGKRHRFISDYTIGFDDSGKILAYRVALNADAGAATDLSMAILERAMLHADNAYFLPDVEILGRAYRTNLPSNTAFRGFGGPQGMAVIEQAIDRVARFLGKDAASVRQVNFYTPSHQTTPYGQILPDNHLQTMFDRLVESAQYFERRKRTDDFNSCNRYFKKGIALTPVKFGISFTTSHLNQAGALVSVYTDGSVAVNHGGTEMGQGLHEKIHTIAAKEFGIDPSMITITPTNTTKVPNTPPTAASSGSDLNGMAVKNAIDSLKKRLILLAIEELANRNGGISRAAETILFNDNSIFSSSDPGIRIPFPALCHKAFLKQISLSSTGYYFTPGLFFDREKGEGVPFHYFAYGMAVSEVMVDLLTGEHTLLRCDILHDTGRSIHEQIDRGQITGGFIQGAGWCTIEEIKWDKNGSLLTDGPDTYKIPTIGDIPSIFRIDLLENAPCKGTIHSSKAVGEPPFMLGLSVWLAIKDAISAAGNHETEPEYTLPATGEVILKSIENINKLVLNPGQALYPDSAPEKRGIYL